MTNNHKKARRNMILSQLEPNQVTDTSLLKAMGRLPREYFVPSNLSGLAYIDTSVEIVPGRFLVAPMIIAKMIQESNIKSEEIVLDIACGTGYSTAVLAHLAGTVVGIESNDMLVEQASQILSDLEIDNAAVIKGSPVDGYSNQGPYDVIILNGSIDFVPQKLLDQLSDYGRLVCVEGTRSLGKAVQYQKLGMSYARKELFDASIPAIPELTKSEGFVFNLV